MSRLMKLTRRALAAGAALFTAGLGQAARAQSTGPFAAARDYSESREGVSLLIEQGGRTLFEAYANGGGPDQAWELASGTKSFSGVLACSLQASGLLDIDRPCADILTEWRDDPAKATVTTRQLLTLTGGVVSGGFGRPTRYEEAAAAPLAFVPGERFEYGPGPYQVFGEMLRRILRRDGYDEDVLGLIRARVLDPAGVHDRGWRRVGGQPTLPSGAQMTAPDWAKWGRWVMDGAGGLDLGPCFQGTPQNPGYGLTFWLMRPGLIAPRRRYGMGEDAAEIAEQGEDIRAAAGAGDQKLYLLPDRDLIIVRQSRAVPLALRGRAPQWSDLEFLRLVLNDP